MGCKGVKIKIKILKIFLKKESFFFFNLWFLFILCIFLFVKIFFDNEYKCRFYLKFFGVFVEI